MTTCTCPGHFDNGRRCGWHWPSPECRNDADERIVGPSGPLCHGCGLNHRNQGVELVSDAPEDIYRMVLRVLGHIADAHGLDAPYIAATGGGCDHPALDLVHTRGHELLMLVSYESGDRIDPGEYPDDELGVDGLCVGLYGDYEHDDGQQLAFQCCDIGDEALAGAVYNVIAPYLPKRGGE